MSLIERKKEHVKISLEKNINFKNKTTWLEYVHLIHMALPEISMEEISLKRKFLGREFHLPFIIEPLTGGFPEAQIINASLAEAAEKLNIPMGVGSMRIALENDQFQKSFKIVREKAPNAFIIANIGIRQIIENGIEYVKKAIEMINADALYIHLNPLQEIIQPEGEKNFKGSLEKIIECCNSIEKPIIIKEVGCGISMEVAKILKKTGIAAIDIAGAGGTSWAAIEYYRAKEAGDKYKTIMGETFWDWGLPTAASLIEVKAISNIEIIASGGIRNGLDAAKCLGLGATMVGFAQPLLWPATRGCEYVLEKIKLYTEELKLALFLTNSKNINDLEDKIVISGPLKEWVNSRGIKLSVKK